MSKITIGQGTTLEIEIGRLLTEGFLYQQDDPPTRRLFFEWQETAKRWLIYVDNAPERFRLTSSLEVIAKVVKDAMEQHLPFWLHHPGQLTPTAILPTYESQIDDGTLWKPRAQQETD